MVEQSVKIQPQNQLRLSENIDIIHNLNILQRACVTELQFVHYIVKKATLRL